MVSASYEASTGRAVKSLPPITPSERGRCNLSEISQSSKLLPGLAAAPTLRTVKFLVAPSTVRMNPGDPPPAFRKATCWAGGETFCDDGAFGEPVGLAGTALISLPADTGGEVGRPSGDPPA